jgi:large subunit ribosomal protein L14
MAAGSKSRAVSAKGVEEFRPYITRAIPVTASLVCTDNTGAKILRVAQVTRYKGRHSRQPAAAVGDFVTVTVKKGPAELLVTPEGEIKGTDIKGPVASEAAEKWPRIANLAGMIV